MNAAGIDVSKGKSMAAVLRPGQVATQALRLNLRVEDDGLSIRFVQAVDFRQGLDGLVWIGQHLSSVAAFQNRSVPLEPERQS